jgi:1-acyl-sn-glycerol-3-phosphate acyltransferase
MSCSQIDHTTYCAVRNSTTLEIFVLQPFVRFLLAPAARAVFRPTVEGAANVPARGPVIFAANHRAALDTAVISFVLPHRRIRFLGKAEYFTGKGPRGRLMTNFVDALGYIPVERGNAHAGLAALGAAQQVLNAGGAFAIYPEGTRSLDGRLHRGHTGVAVLALTTGAPVIPVGLTGTEGLQPDGARIPRPTPITIRFGAPLTFTGENKPRVRREVTDEIMAAIRDLSQQEYVNVYHQRPA